jgi:hypothetical protein
MTVCGIKKKAIGSEFIHFFEKFAP